LFTVKAHCKFYSTFQNKPQPYVLRAIPCLRLRSSGKKPPSTHHKPEHARCPLTPLTDFPLPQSPNSTRCKIPKEPALSFLHLLHHLPTLCLSHREQSLIPKLPLSHICLVNTCSLCKHLSSPTFSPRLLFYPKD
jgi:hypothetical protein